MGTFINESVPVETLKTILEAHWESFAEIPTPNFVIINDTDGEFMRANYTQGDYIMLSMEGTENIKYRGNISYYDRTFPLTLQIGTKEGRQRLRDLWKEIKAILFDNKHDFTGWQLIRILSYTEMTNQDQNIWRAVIKIQLESAGVCVETNV